jgi:hypothetical protein
VESSHSSRIMDSPSFSCYPVRGICDSLSKAAEWLLSARTLLDVTLFIRYSFLASTGRSQRGPLSQEIDREAKPPKEQAVDLPPAS